jgi:hypothetical protein
MAAVSIAILDESIPQQLAESPQADLHVSWRGTSLAELRAAAQRERPQVLVLDLDLLGPTPVEEVERLQRELEPELVITLYKFARRDLVAGLGGERRRALRAPLSVSALRTQMMSVLVRSIFQLPRAAPEVESPRPFVGAPKRFSAAQLGKLAELRSSIECECPNHLSTIVTELQAFEAYAAQCENRNEADAAVHRYLFEETAKARAIMEEALARLVEHERIAL